MSVALVTRKQAFESASKIVPAYAKLCPGFVNQLEVIKYAAEVAFLEQLTGKDVENVREALKYRKLYGELPK